MDEPPPAPAFDLEHALAGIAGRKSVLIYTHDNPDPDSLAAAMSLGRLLEHELGARVTLTHGGIVGRAQNRAMVETLKLTLVPAERIEPDQFDRHIINLSSMTLETEDSAAKGIAQSRNLQPDGAATDDP